jgi:MYXO-CTERM domain-containing protein
MKRSTRTVQNLVMAALGASALAVAAPASADNSTAHAFVMKIAKGMGGPMHGYGGPGNEQPSVVSVNKDGHQYLVTVWMASDVSEEDGPWQLKCSSLEMKATGPEIVADSVQITHYEPPAMPDPNQPNKMPIRPANHPTLATDGENIVLIYGSDKMQPARTQTYVGVLDAMCSMKVQPFRISQNPNRNEGAPTIVSNGGGVFTAGYLSAHGGGYSIAVGLNLSKDNNGNLHLDKTWATDVVTPCNIGRPTITAVSPTRSLFCAAKGDNRPADDGVECGWLDTTNGHLIWKSIIAEAKPLEKEYYGQPSSALLDYGRVAVEVLRSSGEGKKTNQKGSNQDYTFVLEPTDGGNQIKEVKKGIAHSPTHSAVCSGQYGTVDAKGVAPLHMAILGATPTGVGPATLDIAGYDSTTGITFDAAKDSWVVGFHGDSGKLANILGANPGKQGRDFMRCLGDVPNPGYHQKGGFLPDVKTFFVSPHCGNDQTKGEEKNALFLGFTPGATDKPLSSEPPGVGAPHPSDPSGSTSSGAGGSGAGDDPGTDPQTAGGCDVNGSGSGSTGAALGLLGLAALSLSRRRRS